MLRTCGLSEFTNSNVAMMPLFVCESMASTRKIQKSFNKLWWLSYCFSSSNILSWDVDSRSAVQTLLASYVTKHIITLLVEEGPSHVAAELSLYCVGRDSSVGIATRYGLDGTGIKFRLGRDFPHTSRPALEPIKPPIQWVAGLYRG
jgi:hypothetical protein